MTPIDPAALAAPKRLTKAFFRATNPHLDHQRFERKWKRAFDSPLRFVRAFPQAWYLDLTQVPVEQVPGRTDLCFGDLHPENFGFLLSGARAHYVFNDLDDSGPAEVGLDALRWFTTHALWSERLEETDALIDLYRDVMARPSLSERLPPALVPDPAKVREKHRKKLIAGRRLIRSEDTLLSDASAADRRVVEHALEGLGYQTLDVTEREREHGGSGGLRRFWALVESARGDDVLEVKELTRPATAWGHANRPLDDRIAKVRDAVWKGLDVTDHQTVVLERREYVVRSRLSRASLKLDGLSRDELATVLRVQVGLIARHHRRSFAPTELQDLDDWLQASTRVMVDRWTELFDRLH